MAKSKQERDFDGYLDSLKMEDTFNSDINTQADVPLLEEISHTLDQDDALEYSVDSEEEYTEDEIESLLQNIDFSADNTGLSFDQLMPAKKEPTGVTYQRKEKKVSHFLVIRDLVELTPSVCDKPTCKYDAAKACGLREWSKVPANKRRLVLMALDRHKETAHKFVDDSIVDASELPQSWLSSVLN